METAADRQFDSAVLWQALSFGVASLLALAAALLLERRLSAALVQPLGDGWLLAIPIVCGRAALVVHAIDLQAGRGDRFNPAQHSAVKSLTSAGQWLAVLSLPVVAAALSLPGSPPIGFAMLWIVTIGAEFGLWRLRNSGPVEWRLPTRQGTSPVATENDSPPAMKYDSPPATSTAVLLDRNEIDSIRDERGQFVDQETENAENFETDPGVTQKLVYGVAEGRAYVNGLLRVLFSVGQRTAVAHVAFCPAFRGKPAMEAEQTGGPDCEIRSTLSLSWGVRWELKLNTAADESAEVAFEFSALESAELPAKNSNPTS
ncbi:MAG TPA: hypothetical protein VGJ15_08340 [Pirellulales bacterium]